jgi:excisionase family DNA binding protein
VTARPVGNNFCGVWRTAQGAALQPGVINRSEPYWHPGGQCGQLKHQYKAGDDRMEKLLLTVWEAADVLSVSRSRAYELLYAEQLDSVKIGRSRRVALVSRGSWRTVRQRHELSRPQGEGAPTGSPGYLWTDEPPDPTSFTLMLPSSRRGTATLARSIRQVKTAAAAVDSAWATGNHPPEGQRS